MDVDKIKHEIAELLELVGADDEALEAYAAAHVAYVEAKRASNAAKRAHLAALEAALEDGEALPVLDIHDAEPVEIGEDAVFRVTLSKASDKAVTFRWEAPGFIDPTEIPAGETETTVVVPTDDFLDHVRHFTIEISDPQNATLGRSVATGTILAAEEPAVVRTFIGDDWQRMAAESKHAAEPSMGTLPWTIEGWLAWDKTDAEMLVLTIGSVSDLVLWGENGLLTLRVGDTNVEKHAGANHREPVHFAIVVQEGAVTAHLGGVEQDSSSEFAIDWVRAIEFGSYEDPELMLRRWRLWRGVPDLAAIAAEAVPDLPPPLEPPGKLPASGGAVASPVLVPAGDWRDLKTFAAVVKLASAPSTHVKIAGGDSTKNPWGGWVVERHPNGTLQAWVMVGGKAQTARTTGQFPIGRPVFVAMCVMDGELVLDMGAERARKNLAAAPDAFDGESAVGDGYWEHKLAGRWPGEVRAWRAEAKVLTDDELAAAEEAWKDKLEDGDELPVVSIADAAAPVRVGGTLSFPVTLSRASTATVTVAWRAANTSGITLGFEPGVTRRTLDVLVPSNATPGPLTAELFNPQGATIGRAVATGTVLANGGNGGGDGLEPPNNAAVRFDAEVGGAPTHQWIGFGWGANTHGDAKSAQGKLAHFADRAFDELGVGVLRLWTPENTASFLDGYRETYRIAKAHGVHTVIASGFVWRGGITPEKFADGVAATIAGGIEIDIVDCQNEPDGHSGNRITSDLVDAYRRVRTRLDHHGLQRVKIKGFAWAHSGTGGATDEFDELDAARMAGGGKAVIAGSGHCYSDCGRPAIWRDRWAKVGGSMIYDETGNLGLPHGIARSLSAVLHGGVIECAHIGLISAVNPTGEPAAQALVYGDGRRAPWHSQYTIFRHLTRGTVLRPATSGDRWGSLSEDYARHMVRSPGRNPRMQLACGRRPDGSWWLAAVNTTKGTGENSVYVGACAPAALLQPTVRIAELAGKSGHFTARRWDASGVPRPDAMVAYVEGHVRFTAGPGELILLTGAI